MTPRLVRWVVLAVCAAGIVGMIVASVAEANGVALTFGLISASAIACLIVATAVATDGTGATAVATDGTGATAVATGGTVATAVAGPSTVPEARAERVEQLVRNLVDAGADEGSVRELVREASALHRDQR